MEAHSSYSSSSSSLRNANSDHHQYHSSLHSVRKTSTKPWNNNKKPVAPMPPPRPRVYKVDPINFRDLVQKLTGSQPPETVQSPQRLKKIAPPPLDVAARSFLGGDNKTVAVQAPSPVKSPFSGFCRELMSENEMFDVKRDMLDTSMGLSLSPSTYNWCAYYPLLSPGSLSGLEQGIAR